MNDISNIFDTMEYGPAPEDSKDVRAWLKAQKSGFGHFIGGAFTKPEKGATFAVANPADGEKLADVALGTAKDVDEAVAAAGKALKKWQALSCNQRARHLYALARHVQKHSRFLAVLETLDNGKTIRETRDIDIPLVARHFYHHAGWAELRDRSFPGYEAAGVCGQIIPWNFPLLMAAWKIAPALAAGNCTVIKPASQTPLTLLMFAELTADILPPGVLNVVTGPGRTVGQAIAANPRIAKVSFTGETTTGKHIMHAAADHLIPQTMELGGKSPNIFMADVMDAEDAFLDKALEGFTLFAFNKGEVCTCPSRALVHESIFDRFIERAVARVATIRQGDPLDPSTQVGAQASEDQLRKILNYIEIGKSEGAQCLTGGARALPGGELDKGFFVQPTVFVGQNHMRIFQEEIFGPVLSVTTFKTVEEAIGIANDTAYGLGAGVWTRNGNTAYRLGRAIQAGRVWTNCYHQYPAHAAFGGYKASGFGRENHKAMLDHYQQTKNLLVSYDEHALGLF